MISFESHRVKRLVRFRPHSYVLGQWTTFSCESVQTNAFTASVHKLLNDHPLEYKGEYTEWCVLLAYIGEHGATSVFSDLVVLTHLASEWYYRIQCFNVDAY
ncbi:unnamed protein product [Hydatigera taeniaeformis]|uniref:Uncharacterized protein n=1 Tax=Hydatigena taeniaeformis TaxID=6205 RepID=A0A3P7HA13_HYDTA|nr:unnamed protein product [Hydatigera taeniaeformis]